MEILLYIILAFALLFIFALIYGEIQGYKEIKAKGFYPQYYTEMGKYISGHPNIDKSQLGISIYPKDDNFLIFNPLSSTVEIAKIPKKNIKNISIEDETTITRRVGLKRLIAIGIFAFAVKKKQRNELAYIVIDWNDGRFNHETVFEFEGKGSVEKANSSRNKLLRNL